MVVADPEATLLTVCANGYGKRTLFGPNSPLAAAAESEVAGEEDQPLDESADDAAVDDAAADDAATDESGEAESTSSSNRYRTQRRGGKGLRDIKTTDRNGPVIAVVGVSDDDEVLMMTARGKIQRTAVVEISVIGRNTQGVRIMSLDVGDALAAVVRVPRDATAPLSESEAAAPDQPDHSPPDQPETLPPTE
jgi:DNA gyrase subunit A